MTGFDIPTNPKGETLLIPLLQRQAGLLPTPQEMGVPDYRVPLFVPAFFYEAIFKEVRAAYTGPPPGPTRENFGDVLRIGNLDVVNARTDNLSVVAEANEQANMQENIVRGFRWKRDNLLVGRV